MPAATLSFLIDIDIMISLRTTGHAAVKYLTDLKSIENKKSRSFPNEKYKLSEPGLHRGCHVL